MMTKVILYKVMEKDGNGFFVCTGKTHFFEQWLKVMFITKKIVNIFLILFCIFFLFTEN